jgi:putative transcriptional regulator
VTVRFRLQQLLDEREMSQSELARKSGVSFVTVNGMANNRTAQVSLKTLDALCSALGVPPGELLEREPAAKRKGRG